MDAELRKRIAGMSDDEVAELQAEVKSVANARSAVELGSIRPGMKPEDAARAYAEIGRILKEGR